VPILKPIYYREKKSNLYSPSAYFLSTLSCSMVTLLFYPICVGLCSFYFIKFNDDSADNLFRWLSVLLIQSLTGSCFGFFLGCVFDSDQEAILILNLAAVLFNLGAGSFSNLGNTNWVGKFLGYISPMRYCSELLLRRLLNKKFYQGYVY
jgi:hypothetical protein